MSYSLKGRNALITGGSRGLGALVAQKYAAEGCNVAINYLSSKDVAEELASSLRTQYGVNAVTVQGVSHARLLWACKSRTQIAVKTAAMRSRPRLNSLEV
ncbi:hypothetical protein ACP6JD_001556 [Aspergillus fumigatus]